MGRWREAPEGLNQPPYQVTVSVPFMPEQVLPIYGEVSAKPTEGQTRTPFQVTVSVPFMPELSWPCCVQKMV